MDHWQLELLCQVRGLIEPTSEPSPRTQRNWHYAVRSLEMGSVPFFQQFPERHRQRSPAFVFERVDDLAQRALIAAVCDVCVAPASNAHGTVER